MQLDILRFIQSFTHPALDILFAGFSMLSEPIVIVPLLALTYWCIDKRMGRYLLFSLCFSLCINGIIKDFFKAPRPFGEPGITSRRIWSATGHSFPSGHTQSAAAIWGGASLWAKKRWLTGIAIICVIGVGLSRLYLGVHYPADALAGALAGFFCAATAYWIIMKNDGIKSIVWLGLLLAIAILWIGESKDTFFALALYIGFSAGSWVEQRYIHFSLPTNLRQSLHRFTLGLASTGLIFYPIYRLKELHPGLAPICYGFLAFYVVGPCTALFKKAHV
ncbi:phosphatase PAP2 family protein [Oscillospiraceae bacterium MB08-C2-2]|nr:phosphatase PAP2 family protein [Oscillospiraceae bacterium MB08-C2-2]